MVASRPAHVVELTDPLVEASGVVINALTDPATGFGDLFAYQPATYLLDRVAEVGTERDAKATAHTISSNSRHARLEAVKR